MRPLLTAAHSGYDDVLTTVVTGTLLALAGLLGLAFLGQHDFHASA